MKKTLIGLTILIILTAGCSSPSSDPLTKNYDIRPISDIVGDELIVTNFAKDGTATLPVHTTADVACSIVYGKTTDFGSLSVDQDMAGGAHADHSPLLTGLEPDTLYYFRLQGVDNDGVLYLSEVMTFTTPPEDTSISENLASPEQGATITGFSSAFGGASADERWGAGSAFDDNPNSEWSSAGDGDGAWVEVTLAKRALITAVAFHSRAMNDGSAITQAFSIETGLGEMFGTFDIPDTNQPYTFDIAFEATVLRFTLTSTTGGNVGVVDIVVYGEFIDP